MARVWAVSLFPRGIDGETPYGQSVFVAYSPNTP
jgi:hypothetical protein